MKNQNNALLKTLVVLFYLSFYVVNVSAQRPNEPMLVDEKATRKTKALYLNLKAIGQSSVLFGHQDDLAYGVGWEDEPERSDVKEVCGSYPALFGWEMSKLGQRPFNIDTVNFEKMKGWIKEAYRMGGVNSLGWHMDNPVTGGDSWDNTPAVYSIIPGGEHHDWYKHKLDLLADFVKDLKVGLWTKIPVIFRPFHEHTGSWFWWGRGNVTAEEYKALWRFTVRYLRDEKNLHNILYAYSTDVFSSREDYLEFYPGDEYVDIIGYDDYHSIRKKETLPEMTRQLKEIVKLAEEKGKVAALSETGLEAIPLENWFTGYLLEAIKSDPEASRIAYVMVWRNASKSHHYASFKGHHSEKDFLRFCENPFILLVNDLENVYKMPK